MEVLRLFIHELLEDDEDAILELVLLEEQVEDEFSVFQAELSVQKDIFGGELAQVF